MTKKDEIIKEETKEKEEKYTATQIAVLLKLSYYDRVAVAKKYPNKKITKNSWKNLLKKDKINF